MLTRSLHFTVLVVMVLVFLTPSAPRAAQDQTIPAGARAAGTMPVANEGLAALDGEYYLMDGYVRRSDIYAVPAGGITLGQAFAAAGGLEEDDARVYVIRKMEDGKYHGIVKGKWSELANTPAAELQLEHRDHIRVFSLKSGQLWPYNAVTAAPEVRLPPLSELLQRRALYKADLERQGRRKDLASLEGLKSTEKEIGEQAKLFAKPGVAVDFDGLKQRVDQLMQTDAQLQKSMAVLAEQRKYYQRLIHLRQMGSESRIMHDRLEAERPTREQIQKRLVHLLRNG